jgi:hypothetical protein
MDRFLREARAAAQLRHPSIVAIHEAGESGGVPYVVSDFVRGVTLADRRSAWRPTFREAAHLVADVAEALHYAHENPHRQDGESATTRLERHDRHSDAFWLLPPAGTLLQTSVGRSRRSGARCSASPGGKDCNSAEKRSMRRSNRLGRIGFPSKGLR